MPNLILRFAGRTLVLAGLLPLSSFGQDMLPELNMWRPNNTVYSIAVDSANNVAYIGGLFTSLTDPDPPFTTVTRNYAAAIDLTTGEPLPWNPAPDNSVMCMALTETAIYLGGDFYNAGGQPRSRVAAVDKVTGTALAWSTGNIDGPVRAMAIASSKLFIGGNFFFVASATRPYVAAFSLATGALDGWNPQPSNLVLALQPIGSTMYMGGHFTTLNNGLPSPYLAGVDMGSGTSLMSVDAPNGIVRALTTANNRLYLGGDFTEVGGLPRNRAAALVGGSLTSWNPAPSNSVHALVKVGSQIGIGGAFLSAGGQSYNSRLVVVNNTNGTATTWNPGVDQDVFALASSGGRIIAGGWLNRSMQFDTPRLTSFIPAPPLVRVQPRIHLDGCYVSDQVSMHDSLRRASLLPQTEPFSAMGYTYTADGAYGTITANAMSNASNLAIVDWVVVELRDAVNPALIVASKRGVVLRNGNVMDVNRLSPLWIAVQPGNYHVAIRHRNHLGVMTAAPVALSATGTTIDFTSSATATWGTDARKNVGNVMTLWPGDATFDGQVKYVGNGNDRDPILTAVGGSTPTNTAISVYANTDVNMDGLIKYIGNNNDRDPILQTIGGTTPTAVRTQQLP